MYTYASWLKAATKELASANIESARLDAEIILAHTVHESRTWLHAHGDEVLDERTKEIAAARLQLRRDRVPVAYIIGHKEFYGRNFKVTPATLVPRPESETIIELLAEQKPQPGARLIDVGTGTGCLGITAKLEFPDLHVCLADISQPALVVAKTNARLHQADVMILQSDLLKSYPFKADYVLANLPYVDKEWQRSPETAHEPAMALFALDNGLALIKQLLNECAHRLNKNGVVILEADPRQHHLITAFAEKLDFLLLEERGFCQAYRI